MSVPLKRLVFLFCSLGFMFLAGWEAARVENARQATQINIETDEKLIQEDSGAGEGSGSMQDRTGQNSGEQPRVALTFDDGPNSAFTESLLDGLKERGVKATFFLLGQNLEGNEEIVRRIQEEGHLIGNHTYHHVRISAVSEAEAKKEIESTSNAIYELTGVYTSFVRPPYGEWKKGLDFHVTMIPVLWTIDSRDWVTQDVGQILDTVLPLVEDGSIILMHDEFAESVEAALQIVDTLQKDGYRFVTADDLLLK